MFKKVILIAVLMVSLVAVCSASPLMDYSAGKTALDLNFKLSADLELDGQDVDGKTTNFDFGLTTGLGKNFAIQYRYNTADSKTISSGENGNGGDFGLESFGEWLIYGQAEKFKLRTHELNLLYKLDKNVAAFVGWVQIKPEIKVADTLLESVDSSFSDEIDGYQVGLVGTTELADKLLGYGILAAGNHLTGYELGLSYEIEKNLELNLGYKNTKYKDLEIKKAEVGKFDYKVDGFTLGLTYKF